MENCSCTDTDDCEYCQRLEDKGHGYIGINGAKGVALVCQERDRLKRENGILRDWCDWYEQLTFGGKSLSELKKLKEENEKARELLASLLDDDIPDLAAGEIAVFLGEAP